MHTLFKKMKCTPGLFKQQENQLTAQRSINRENIDGTMETIGSVTTQKKLKKKTYQ